MKIITCYMPPTSGAVDVDGYSIEDHSLEVRRKIGYLPESNPLYLDMNVVEYLEYAARLHGIDKSKLKQQLNYMIDVCGLKEVRHKDIGEMSKGYRQRVGLAQAMIHDPDVLILDEPTSGLDPNQIVEIRNLIKQLGGRKRSFSPRTSSRRSRRRVTGSSSLTQAPLSPTGHRRSCNKNFMDRSQLPSSSRRM
jgi:ABC-2 type transport system ATP-binding protein